MNIFTSQKADNTMYYSYYELIGSFKNWFHSVNDVIR